MNIWNAASRGCDRNANIREFIAKTDVSAMAECMRFLKKNMEYAANTSRTAIIPKTNVSGLTI